LGIRLINHYCVVDPGEAKRMVACSTAPAFTASKINGIHQWYAPSSKQSKLSPERKITHDIKGDVVEPFHNIESIALLCKSVEISLYLIDEFLDDALLLSKDLFGETIRQSLALTCVIIVVGHTDCLNAWHRIDCSDMNWVFGVVPTPCSIPINICPCLY
jgi:hypothetical protein